MLNFGGITHVIENPKGHAPGWNYSLVGSVHITMVEARKPTPSDIMAGRVRDNGLAYHGRKWETIDDILSAASQAPEVQMCSAAGCACRKLFNLGVRS